MNSAEDVPTGIYTLGHSNHSREKFLALLTQQQIKMVVDVRSKPFSAYHPQFNRDTFKAWLGENGIEYLHLPVLGGMNDIETTDPKFVEAMQKVSELGTQTSLAMVCSERDPKQCHRSLKLTPWLLQKSDHVVKHILPDGRVEVADYQADLFSHSGAQP